MRQPERAARRIRAGAVVHLALAFLVCASACSNPEEHDGGKGATTTQRLPVASTSTVSAPTPTSTVPAPKQVALHFASEPPGAIVKLIKGPTIDVKAGRQVGVTPTTYEMSQTDPLFDGHDIFVCMVKEGFLPSCINLPGTFEGISAKQQISLTLKPLGQ
jgi:hypothetical protein